MAVTFIRKCVECEESSELLLFGIRNYVLDVDLNLDSKKKKEKRSLVIVDQLFCLLEDIS